VSTRKKPEVPPLRSLGFPVETRGFDQHHAVFLKKTAYVVVAAARSRKSGFATVGMTILLCPQNLL
jgi:hypothetical protein